METLAHLRMDQPSLCLLVRLGQGDGSQSDRRAYQAGAAAFVSLSSRVIFTLTQSGHPGLVAGAAHERRRRLPGEVRLAAFVIDVLCSGL